MNAELYKIIILIYFPEWCYYPENCMKYAVPELWSIEEAKELVEEISSNINAGEGFIVGEPPFETHFIPHEVISSSVITYRIIPKED